jgi:hypothetical protein
MRRDQSVTHPATNPENSRNHAETHRPMFYIWYYLLALNGPSERIIEA